MVAIISSCRPSCDPDIAVLGTVIVASSPPDFFSHQPFCDGSHFFQRTGLSPLKFKVQETRTVALCTCKATQHPPYCDGTHKSEQVLKAEVGSPF